MLLWCPASLVASACGARSELAEGFRTSTTAAGTGGLGGVGGSCTAQPCTPAVGPGAAVWSQLYGSAGQQAARSIAVDGMGNIVVAGGLFGPDAVDFGCGALTESPGGGGMFVAKLDRCGACAWSRAVDGVNVVGVALSAAGDIVVIGDSIGGSVDFGGAVLTSPGPAVFVAELSGDGSPVWARGFGGGDSEDASCEATGVAVDGSGNVLVAGSFTGALNFGGDVLTSADGASTFVGKLGPDGTAMWSRSFGPNVSGAGVATDASGDLLFTGSFETPVDFGCGALAGMENDYFQPFVVELDSGGVCRWSRAFPTTGSAQAYGIATDASSNVVVTGLLGDGSIDLGGGPLPSGLSGVFVVALHADGSYRWGKGFGNTQGGGSVAVNGAGDVFLQGMLTGPADFGGGTIDESEPIFLASLDAAGSYPWAKTFAAASDGYSVGALAADSSSRVLFAGGVDGTIDFGCGPLSSAGASDVFVAELAQ